MMNQHDNLHHDHIETPENKPHDKPVTPVEMNLLPGTEDPAKRTRTGKIFSLGRNLYQAVLYPDPVHYQAKETGEWHEIDNTLVATVDANSEPCLTNRSNDDLKVELRNARKAAMVALQNEDGRKVSWQLEGAQEVEPQPVAHLCPQHEGSDRRRDVLDRNEGEAVYLDILPGVHLRCQVQGTSFKEDVVFSTPESVRELSFLLSAPDMAPSLLENCEIELAAPAGDIPFTLPAPFMKDAGNEKPNGSVRVTLEPTGKRDVWRLTYTPDKAWLVGAQFPVVLDPAVISKKHSSAIEDNFITSAQPSTVQTYSATGMKVSYNSSNWGTSKSLIKFLGSGLPAIDSSYYITKAYFSVMTKTAPTTAASVYLKEVLADWNSQTITYNNAPALSTMALDYMYMDANNTWYTYDVSNLVRKWYAGTNYGFALESTTGTYIELYTSDHAYNKPYVTINYVSLAGLADSLSYEDQNVGRAGVGHVSLYNGNLVFERQDTLRTGNRVPLSVSHVYNSCYHASDAFAAGYGWKLNLQQCLHRETLTDATGDVTYYVYTDASGTRHHFKLVSGEWKDQSGLGLTLTLSASTATIQDKGDNTMVFGLPTVEFGNNYANVKMLQSMSDACGSTAVIQSNAARQLTEVTDGGNRYTAFGNSDRMYALYPESDRESGLCEFSYNAAGQFTTLRQISGVPDLFYVYYTYNSLGLLETATSPDGLKVTYEYYTNREPYRVKKVTLSNGTTVGNSRLYEYGDCLTVVTDQTVENGKKLYYHFNDYGNVVSVNDELGYACFAKYSDSLPINHPEVVSKMQRVVCNLFKNHNFESSSDWSLNNATSGNSIAYVTDTKYLGSQCLKIIIGANQGSCSARQSILLEKGKTYTVSFYAKRTSNVDVWVQVSVGGFTFFSPSFIPQMSSEFSRLAYTFTVPESATSAQATIFLIGGSQPGTTWFDCAQLEEGAVANRYNLLINGDFSYNSGAQPTGWLANSTNTTSDIVYTTYDGVKPAGLSANTMRLYGTGRTKYAGIYQDLPLSGAQGDVFVAGGWSLNHSKPRKGEDFRYDLRVAFLPTDSTTRQNTPSIEWSEEWTGWQFAAGPVVAPCAYQSIRFNVDYERNINYTEFDGFFLHQEEFGQTFQYDAKGNVLSTKNLASLQDGAVYDSFNNLTSYRQPGRAATITTALEYGTTDAEKKKHLLKKSTSPLGVAQEAVYDTAGNQLESKTSSANTTAFMKSTKTYEQDKIYPETHTDARGKTSTTYYSTSNGELCYVQDANGQQINYTYDYVERLRAATAVADGKTYQNEYNYTNDDRLTQAKHNTTSDTESDVVYTFGYDPLGNPTTVSVGTQTLSTNVYTDTGDKMLARVEYGNGGKVYYTRDGFKRVTGIRIDEETIDRYQYAFDACGQVGQLVDNHLGRAMYHDYDTANRLMQTRLMQGNTRLYATKLAYDTFNNLASLTEKVSSTNYTTTCTYDNENRPTEVQYGSASNKAAYTYDALGRISGRTLTVDGNAYASTYTFAAGGQGANSTTPLVETIYQNGQEMGYTYDDVGNIISERRNLQTTTYGYDLLGQLVRVNDPYQGKTWTYTYDRGGNLLSKSWYDYTLSSTLGTPFATYAYTYGDSNWKDKLTAYNGSAITYDAIGNPLTYDGWTLVWQAGRQLVSMVKTGTSTAYEYNADGLRVRKTVNGTATDYTLYGKRIAHLKQGSNNLHFFYDAQGRPSVLDYNGTKYGYVHSLQGDVLALVDATGTAVVEYRYDAWGAPLSTTGTMATTLGALNPFRYRGYVFDAETGLYYLRSRYYHPVWDRFVNADALIGECGRLFDHNLYSYCVNTPITKMDEHGNKWTDVIHSRLTTALKRFITTAGALLQLVVNRQKADAFLQKQDKRLTKIMSVAPSSAGAMSIGLQEEKYLWFYEHVKTGGEMDYKGKNRKPRWALSESFNFLGKEISLEVYGNINYGYFGSALAIPAEMLYAGGGFAALTAPNGDTSGGLQYYYDSEHDHNNIFWGISLYQ